MVVDITVGNGMKHTEVVWQLRDVCQEFTYKKCNMDYFTCCHSSSYMWTWYSG